jgi:hypothetical protein
MGTKTGKRAQWSEETMKQEMEARDKKEYSKEAK